MRPSPWALAAAFVLLIANPALAQDSDRIEELQREVHDLKERVGELEAEQEAELESEDSGATAVWRPRLPTLTIGGFGSVAYVFSHIEPELGGSDTSNHFLLGDFDLYFVSGLSDRFSFLADVLFEFDTLGDTRVDVERLLIQYEHADWLNFAIGRGHTPIGYWNTYYHHGVWLWTTTRRPLIFEFEDEGGILPLHFVGIQGSGRFDTRFALFDYAAVVSNGRGPTTDAIQITDDLNDSKMASLRLSMQPRPIVDLNFGLNILYDDIPPDPDVPARNGSIDELIAGGFAVYRKDPLELLIEAQMIRHDDEVSGGRFYSHGGYVQLAYRVWKLKPYYRFDWLSIADGDPFYLEVPEAQDTIQNTVGVRFDWARFVALKLEYQRKETPTFDSDTAVAQISFAF